MVDSDRLGYQQMLTSFRSHVPVTVPELRLRLRRNGQEGSAGCVVRVGGSTDVQSLEQLARLSASLLLQEDEQAHFEASEVSFFLSGGDCLKEFGLLRTDDVVHVAFAGSEKFGAMKKLNKPAEAEPLRNPFLIRLDKIDVNQLSEVNQVDQYFAARIYLEFVLVDGAQDAALMASPGVIPPGPGRRPNAAWYLERYVSMRPSPSVHADISCINHAHKVRAWCAPSCARLQVMNAREVQVLEQIVRPHPNKKDILMIYHVRGTFFEAFELMDFPFDGQGLTTTIVILNRSDGPFAVDLKIDRPRMVFGVDFSGFYHHSSWILRELLAISAHHVGFTSKDGQGNEYAKRFPAVSIEGELSARAHILAHSSSVFASRSYRKLVDAVFDWKLTS